ncbi:potassium channel family protein [Natronobiforma cellulositropha]|uniref:potassium channel family protein n=1 Tax=Natronobiforma cellulositropha TaxID=1679076 RepID=UPI0021D571B9|nr:potassium channel family protein [Natronobiforma cellulositropha]
MNAVYLVVGTGVLVLVVVDILWTTLWVDGGSGPLSSRLATGTWRALRALTRDDSRALSIAGPLILALTLALWIALIWTGWAFVFAGGEPALRSTHTGDPADWTGRFYYAAYTMFTNGNGDYTPTAGRWELASSLTTATGMAFVTLGVSYVLTVLGAVTQKRSFASDVTGLGETSEAFVAAGWHDGFEGLDLPLETLATDLSTLAEQHKSYPILHYYHSERGSRASAMAVPILDDALTLVRHGVPDEHGPSPTLVERARSSTESYLETLDAAFVEPSDEVPPPPDLERLRAAGVPTVGDEAFADALDGMTDRRRTLLGVVEADAWHWPPAED